MYVEKLRAKLLSGKNNFIKDENGEKTGELGIYGINLLLDFKENKQLDNKVFSARAVKPITDKEDLPEYEKRGYIGELNLLNVPFAQDVLISADIPLKDDFSEQIKLYDMKFL